MGNSETTNSDKKKTNKSKHTIVQTTRWALVCYDILILISAYVLIFGLFGGAQKFSLECLIFKFAVYFVCILASRLFGKVYGQVLRYGGIQVYIRLIVYDSIGFCAYYIISRLAPIENITMIPMTAWVSLSLLGSLLIRMVYRYAYKRGTMKDRRGRFLLLLLRVFAHMSNDKDEVKRQINVAILGAGNIGVSLAQELLNNKDSIYNPVCFIDINKEKTGRKILTLPVFNEGDDILYVLSEKNIQEVIFTVQNIERSKKQDLYQFYKNAGCKVKVYDAPQIEKADEKRTKCRDFSVEELLFRREQFVVDEQTKQYYNDKVILITGGGGSIGSEICRQLAKMNPRKLIVLDIYENGAYDVQQELRIKYKGSLDLQVEICSIVDMRALERVFEAYRPQIVINAAAHKHVPLMEHNCIEAIVNNVLGCKNIIDCCEKYNSERFMMVSTDKAVNPTNVMGATKRMCEMLALSASADPNSKVKYSATRFGNVLGSAGSVIPLFRKQIQEGGPVTITDKKIIRYFMTIPEASQLVLASGAMANNRELFVLDMGEPVKIMDLAESMIRLMGAHDIEIIETGLRPGEKLYEELLLKTDNLQKTRNSQIFIEQDQPLTPDEITSKLNKLQQACNTGDDNKAREALRAVVPTFRKPEEINEAVGK